MKQKPFLLKLLPGASIEAVTALAPEMERIVAAHGGDDFSLWLAEDMIFGYFELEDGNAPCEAAAKLRALTDRALRDTVFAVSMCNMHLMYDVINRPAEDKSRVVYRRVFLTRLKPGCTDEYFRLHQGLLEGRRKAIQDGTFDPEAEPSSNFTIWNAGDFICSYNEMTELPSENDTNAGGNETWERHMLTLMDWLTDDADMFTEVKHEKIKRLY